ncbi:CocE/NonD family hydrolase [Mycolicibacterium aichiense]|uniref:CocE/NonD family hydrolase n=1 Tax=Mycolicibacterium aichiense TaxID=1799 RepID=UPI000E029C0F|nr:CocE/NonD family hydrolase [Mycolicibacterium aichiense]MCV7020942.1 peptidase S15 [Mycolicibacterium aichiense]STZ25139.1 X-Pro dipeptidyl-peptidase (S15 family) [Mycolicibacterium aichiense]
MGASRFVGRVGGLAVALGVGAAVFSTGYGVAWADGSTGSSGAGSNSSSASSGSDSSGTGSKGPSASTGSSKRTTTAGSGQAVGTGGAKTSSKHSKTGPAQVRAESAVSAQTTSSTAEAANNSGSQSGSGGGADVVAPSASSTAAVVTPVASLAPKLPVLPSPSAISSVLTTALHDVLDPFSGGLPRPAVDSPLALTFAALQRRTSASALASNPIAINPVLVINDGIIDGTTGATGASGLTYTLISGPNKGGKITFSATGDTNYQLGNFSYLPDQSVLGGTVNEQFKILVAQKTQFDQIVESIPLLGGLAGQVIVVLHQTPVLGDLLAPIIGYSQVATFNSTAVLPATDPVAYTYKMPSFDGTLISVNWFPKLGLTGSDTAPTILDGPGLATAGQTDPYTQYGIGGLTPGVSLLRDNYNVVTWDPRGEFASGGILQLDSPFFEARDVSSILNYVAGLDNSLLDGPNDPRVGMVGGSYGGGIQLTSAATDPRIDAIVPGISWNSLNNSLYPGGSFKTAYASLLLLSLVLSKARINNLIYQGIITGDLFGVLSNSAQALLAGSGPTSLLNQLKAPTLLIQGTVDVLFTLQQAIDNAQTIIANPYGTPVKMIWFCGGHGVCLTNDGDVNPNLASTFAWLDYYVKDGNTSGTPNIPNFQFTDQNGNWYQSDFLPTTGSGLFGTPDQAVTGASGGTLGIVPIIGGSGPAPQAAIPYSLGLASKANNAINVAVPTQVGTTYLGAPTVSFDYQGLGNTRFVYAQLVDNKTGLVVGNLVTPVAVTMDGRTHTASINMENIVYTAADPSDDLTLQITSSATAYERFTAFGVINISNISLTLPTADPTKFSPEP